MNRTLKETILAAVLVFAATQVAFAQQQADRIPAQSVSNTVANKTTASTNMMKKYAPIANYDYVGEADYSMYGNSGLFANYYSQGMGNTAEMYPAPFPTPALVGHTYYTYEALKPHEMLYNHKRVYWTPYGDSMFYGDAYGQGASSGLNKTTVVWQSGCHHYNELPLGLFPFSNIRAAIGRHTNMYTGGGGYGAGSMGMNPYCR